MPSAILALGLFLQFGSGITALGQSVNDAATQVSPVVSPEERQALLALYKETDGDHWKKHDGWLGPPGSECAWYGLLCAYGYDKPNVLAHVRLAENNLNGRIPDAISQLIHLRSLDLFGNHLSGRLPDALIERWLAGSLWISAEPPLLTDVSEIDFEFDPSALLCGTQRIILRADGSAHRYTRQCRNRIRRDRTTYCEMAHGTIPWEEFALLAWVIEKNGFFSLQHDYQRSISDSVFVSTRVTRAGKVHEVVEYAGGGPFTLWTVQRTIEGIASELAWEKPTTQPHCPAWDKSGTSPR